MVSVQKKLNKSNKVLAAFTFETGMAIGCKNSGGCTVNSVVFIKENEDGTTTMVINKEKLEELKCTVEME